MSIIGLGLIILGFVQNNSVEAQVYAVFSSGNFDPGTVWIVFGVVLLAAGLIIIFLDKTGRRLDLKRWGGRGAASCSRCGNRVSQKAAFCPHCGAVITHDYGWEPPKPAPKPAPKPTKNGGWKKGGDSEL